MTNRFNSYQTLAMYHPDYDRAEDEWDILNRMAIFDGAIVHYTVAVSDTGGDDNGWKADEIKILRVQDWPHHFDDRPMIDDFLIDLTFAGRDAIDEADSAAKLEHERRRIDAYHAASTARTTLSKRYDAIGLFSLLGCGPTYSLFRDNMGAL